MKVEADTVHIKVKCKPKNGEKGEKKAAMSSSAPAPPAAAPAKRKASEKQLEHLKKAREARAAKKAAEGGTSKAAEKPKAAPKAAPSTSKPAEKPKETALDFDALRDRARVAADKEISIKMLQTIYLGIGSFASIEKRNREQATEMFSRVLSELKIRKRKGVFISGDHALTERQGELLIKAIGVTLRKKYLDSNEAKEDEKDERSKDRPTQIGNTLLMFNSDEKSMKELFRLVPTA